MHPAFAAPGGTSVPVWFVNTENWTSVRGQLGATAQRFAETAKFEPKAGQSLLLPGDNGALSGVLFGIEPADKPGKDRFLPGRLPGLVPAGTYRFANAPHDTRLAVLAFALGSYKFTRYRKAEPNGARLEIPQGVDGADVSRIAEGVALARDLINTPANDMGPAELEQAARDLAEKHGATVQSIVGDDLLKQNFPLIHAVGRAAARAPRLIDLAWGDAAAPKITLVGKGVCFDTGGLDIKPDSGMLIMKKDMGGAANVLAAAHMIMDAKLKLRLRVLIPAVENAIAGDAFRPLDIYTSRKGITVEIGNTDAEGRLVLADALALADEEKPELIVDMATLTGAARVALGPELPPLFTHDDQLAADFARHADAERDPVVAHAAVAAIRVAARFKDRRHQQCRRTARRLDHGGAVSLALRHRREGLGALRHLRMDPERQARTPGRGRMSGCACALCAAAGAVRDVMNFDPRITPARPGLAAKHLEGRVSAARYVKGEEREVIEAQAPLREAPSPDAPLMTEALMGERVTVYEFNDEGWAWGQLADDGYVGWLPAIALIAPRGAPTHKVAALRTLAFPGPSIKLPPTVMPPLGAKLAVTREQDHFAVSPLGFLPAAHLAPLGRNEIDFVAVAERFLGTPYLWGGKTNYGLDCSGLLQVSLAACGVPCPRDSDMQERALGSPIEAKSLRRGDLVFWKGHVAIARDENTFVHANAFHMGVAIEPIGEAIARISAAGSE